MRCCIFTLFHEFRQIITKIFLLSIFFLLGVGIFFKAEAASPRKNLITETNPVSQLRSDSTNWKDITSVEDVWKYYPDRIRLLINALNLNTSGFENIQTALQKRDTVKATKAIISYYQHKSFGFEWFYKSDGNQHKKISVKASKILHDSIDVVGKGPVHIPRQSDGGLPWNYLGPNNKEKFGYRLNRNSYLLTLLKAWRKSHNSSYSQYFDQLLRDWTIHNPLPARGSPTYKVLSTSTKTLDWRDIGQVKWRPLEAGIRMFKVWPQVFYGFQQADAFTPAARILMLSSIAKHINYLYKYHDKHHNHALSELNGLAMVGLAFPEFKNSNKLIHYSREQMANEMNWLIYPDGLSKELTSSYHVKVLKLFKQFKKIVSKAGKSVGTAYNQTFKKMYNYIGYSMRPSGEQPLNNDSDLSSVQSLVFKAAHKYNGPDWKWISTNGEAGKKPVGIPSKTFPWAGINIMRSGWGKNAQWAFFDTGPYGTAHQHNDKLHLSISAYGRNLLVDAGRYTYENYFNSDPQTWRGYFKSSFSHNVLLVDGKGQNPGPNTADSAMKEGLDYIHKPSFDYARSTFDQGFQNVKGKAMHTRAVLYKRGDYWVVVDHIKTDRPRKIQPLWHYAPSCKVKSEGTEVVTTNAGKGNLRIIPVSNVSWSVDIVRGQTKPINQGWFSPIMDNKEPSPVAVYSTKIKNSATFAWLLIPGKGTVPTVKTQLLESDERRIKMEIQEQGENPIIVTIPFAKGVDPALEK